MTARARIKFLSVFTFYFGLVSVFSFPKHSQTTCTLAGLDNWPLNRGSIVPTQVSTYCQACLGVKTFFKTLNHKLVLSIDRFHSRDQRPYWFNETKENRVQCLVHQYGRHSFVLVHQHGRRDVM